MSVHSQRLPTPTHQSPRFISKTHTDARRLSELASQVLCLPAACRRGPRRQVPACKAEDMAALLLRKKKLTHGNAAAELYLSTHSTPKGNSPGVRVKNLVAKFSQRGRRPLLSSYLSETVRSCATRVTSTAFQSLSRPDTGRYKHLQRDSAEPHTLQYFTTARTAHSYEDLYSVIEVQLTKLGLRGNPRVGCRLASQLPRQTSEG